MFKEDNFIKELNHEPLLSIIIPSYNRREMLLQALQSIESQTYKHIEVIIIDDNSSDGTYEYFSKNINPNITYIRNKVNKGAGYSRKIGYKISNGEYLIFMDDDDYYTDFDFFYKAIEIFNANLNNNLSFVSANSEIKYERNNSFKKEKLNVEGLINQTDYLKNFQFDYNKPNSTFTTIFNKNQLENANFANMEMVNDSSIYLRGLLSGNAYIMNDFIGVYRIYGNNISNSIKDKFLIDNLKEKKYVYQQIENREFHINLTTWWYQQVFITLNYYINGTKPDIKSFLNVYKWCLFNTNEKNLRFRFSIIFLNRYFFVKSKQMIKKVLEK